MSRRSFKKYMPSAEKLKGSKSLRFLGDHLDDPNLFHLNRRSASLACFWGILIALLPPIPMHTPLAAVIALFARCNLPLIIAVVWIANPITLPFIMTSVYYLGCWVLQVEPVSTIEFTWNGFVHELALIWKPYLLGSVISQLILAPMAYVSANFFWHWSVKRKWRARQLRHKKITP